MSNAIKRLEIDSDAYFGDLRFGSHKGEVKIRQPNPYTKRVEDVVSHRQYHLVSPLHPSIPIVVHVPVSAKAKDIKFNAPVVLKNAYMDAKPNGDRSDVFLGAEDISLKEVK